MASWIKMRTDLRGDPRVRAITLACFGEDSASWQRNVSSVTGALHALWSLGDQYTTDGELNTYTAGGLDSFVGIKGFAKAMTLAEVDWLEVRDKCLIIKRFEEHNGASAKQRAQTTKRVSKHRSNRDGGVTIKALPEEIREDKRRRKDASASCGEPASAGESPPPVPSFPFFDCVPGRRSRSKTWQLADSHLAELVATFPGVDVPQECREAWGWLRANPTKRKTAGGMAAFLHRWMSKAQNDAGRPANGRHMSTRRGAADAEMIEHALSEVKR